MKLEQHEQKELEKIQNYYNSVYYNQAGMEIDHNKHYQNLSAKIGIQQGEHVLDVACGCGDWLLACKNRGAIPYGVDLSKTAINVCRSIMPEHKFYVQPAEELPFDDQQFDVISCLGALEHFVNPQNAIAEMIRVAKPNARILLLVPNADFLGYRLGIYSGTDQAEIKEDVRTLKEWLAMFESAGLEIQQRWRDLHILSWQWISMKGKLFIPVRALQALIVSTLPIKQQYQVYHLCRPKGN